MRIAAINGSPKSGESNSGEILSIIHGMLGSNDEWSIVSTMKMMQTGNSPDYTQFRDADVIIIAFPLYVDGIPYSLMRFLENLSHELASASTNSRTRVFAVANCGFYEGVQNTITLQMIEHFCIRTGLRFCGGCGIGTGEMITGLKNVSQKAGIRKPVIKALREVANAIAAGPEGRLAKNIYAQHALPWLLYKLIGELGWRSMAKKKGLRTRDLHAQPLLHVQ